MGCTGKVLLRYDVPPAGEHSGGTCGARPLGTLVDHRCVIDIL